MAIQKITSGIIQDGAIAAADIVSVANTAITGNITSSQIAPDQTLNGNVSVTGTLSTPNTFGFKNRIINGGMVIDQRNAGASVTPTNGQYTLDRWCANMFANTGKFTVQQNAGAVTPPVGFTKYLGVTSTSSYSIGVGDIYTVFQIIEGFNIADLAWGTANAKTVTLSFQVYSSLTGTFGGALANAGTRSYPFTYSIPVANTWTTISVTIAGDTSGTWATDNSSGIQLRLGLGVGSTYSTTANSWAAGNYFSATGATSVVGTSGATFYITGVQLEKGSTATSFDYRPYGTELELCQRYFEKSYNMDVVAGTSTNVGCERFMSPRTVTISSPDFTANSRFKTRKRSAPTTVVYSTTGASGNVRDASGAANVSATTGEEGDTAFSLNFAITDARLYAWQWTASSEL